MRNVGAEKQTRSFHLRPHRRSQRRVGRRWGHVEMLESRQLLAVVISELMASNVSTLQDIDGDYSDWLELENTGNTEVELNGWYLTDNVDNPTKWQLPAVTLSPSEQLVVFASDKNRRTPGGELHTNFKLSADGEYLGLIRADGVSVEHAYAPSFPQQTADVSYGLQQGVPGFFAEPTPGAPNQNAAPDTTQSIVINEIMYSLPREGILDAEDIQHEFIELMNRGTTTVDLAGWQITRGVEFSFPAVSIAAGDTLVVAADIDAFRTLHPDVSQVVGGWVGKLSNSGETLNLIDAEGREVDRVRYADSGEWGTRGRVAITDQSTSWEWVSAHDGGGRSLELINPILDNNLGANWRASDEDGGSPGRINSASSTNAAPLVTDVQHSPAVPQASDEVIITAEVHDESIVDAQVLLQWRTSDDAPFGAITMVDDGTGGDVVASDGTYTGVIPPQADLTVVEFYVQATDASAQSGYFPRLAQDGTPSANALYQVIDSFDDEAPWSPGSRPIYHVIMTPAARAEFERTARLLNTQFNATFIAITGSETVVRYNTGVRYRGSGSRQANPPNNRINLPSDADWNGDTAININTTNPVNQVSGAALYELAGVDAGDSHGVRLFSNGIDLKNGGTYTHAEALDTEWAENHFADDPGGNLYKGRRSDESPPGGEGAGLQYRGEDPLPYVSYLKDTNASEADYRDVIELTRVLNTTTDEEFPEAIERIVDVDQWFRALAMNSLMNNTEFGLFTGDQRGDDYAMYRGLNDPRFRLLPYDWDTLYSNVQAGLVPSQNVAALNRLINHPEFRPRYYAQYLDLIDNVILTDDLETTVAQSLNDIAGSNRIQQIVTFMRDRAEWVKSRINDRLANDSDDTVTTTASVFDLSGTYPEAAARSVLVAGQPTTLTNGRWQFISDDTDSVTLLESGSTWSYLDDGSDQGTEWRHVSFDDTSWATGPGQLGYGDGDEATVIGFGPDADNRYVTTYFRTRFDVSDAASFSALQFNSIFDDGMAVYLNGTEILRSELPADATFDTLSTTLKGQEVENAINTFTIGAIEGLLVEGTNVLAVEVHQGGPDSPDVSFDMEISGFAESDFLTPGINRLPVVAYEGLNGSGAVVAETFVDVFYDTDTSTIITSDIAETTTLTQANSPYRVQGSVRILPNVTLTIEPGVTIAFDDESRFRIEGNLIAVGSESQPIHFTRSPGAGSWNGLQFRQSTGDNLIQHAVLHYATTNDGMIGVENSKLTLLDSELDHADRRRIRSIDSSLIVKNTVFENIFDPGEAPTTDNQSEHIWGRGIPIDGEWILDGNDFGHITGHNDSVDFDSVTDEGRYALILNNQFAGGGDDALDMTGNVYIAGNRFMNFIKDEFNVDPGESNTISSSSGEFWVVGNVFDNVQHASLVKEEAFMHFINNTVIHSEFAPLYFDLPGQTSGPGRGANVINSVFAVVDSTFDQIQNNTQLVVENSFLPASDRANFVGNQNRFGDPHVGGESVDYQPLTNSPTLGAGINGSNMGVVPLGATITNRPPAQSSQRSVTLHVAGPGTTHYRYQFDDGPVNGPFEIDQPIQLDDLSIGSHQVFVWGQNAIGDWQSEPNSISWFTTPSLPGSIIISEVLANNENAYLSNGQFNDVIELYNFGDSAVDLSGYRLSDRRDDANKYVFTAGTTLEAGAFLVVDNRFGTGLGFGIDQDGDAVYLFDRSGVEIDSIEFGLQIPDYSLGRVGPEMAWTLNIPSLGGRNVAAPIAGPHEVKINEWYAAGNLRLQEERIELYNPQTYAADLSGVSLTDEPDAFPRANTLPAHSYLAPGGYRTFTAEGNDNGGNDQLDFQLAALHEHLALIGPEGERIDQVIYGPQTANISSGRSPDGANNIGYFEYPSFGATNETATPDVVSIASFDWNQTWRFNDTGTVADQWQTIDFDDTSWQSGAGLLGFERPNERPDLPDEIRTLFSLGNAAYYFRTSFDLPANNDLSDITVNLTTAIDDGAVIYVNGVEFYRLGMPEGEITSETLAARDVNEAQQEGPFLVPSEFLRAGQNVIAVEVHQVSTNSGDMVFGMQMVAERVESEVLPVDALRITEMMYAPQVGPEYLELQNISDQAIDISGIRLSDGIEFEFPTGTILAAQEFIVVTEDAVSFRETYGVGTRVAGEYDGKLNNGGETISLLQPSPVDTAILRFDYAPTWYPATDANGQSLSIVDPDTAFDRWSLASRWQATSPSPGRSDGAGMPADLNGDQRVTSEDIDFLCAAIHDNNLDFDLNADGTIDVDDLDYFVLEQLGSKIGDANLDGVFNSNDFVSIFIAGEYDDGIANNSTWSDGDWNCDGEFDSRDIVAAFTRGGYVAAALPISISTPSPSAILSQSDLAAALLAQELRHAVDLESEGTDQRKRAKIFGA